MPTTDTVLGDAIEAIEVLRVGIDVLRPIDSLTAGIIDTGLTLAYESLVHIRQALLTATTEDLKAALAVKAEKAIQELAALKFDAAVPGGGGG